MFSQRSRIQSDLIGNSASFLQADNRVALEKIAKKHLTEMFSFKSEFDNIFFSIYIQNMKHIHVTEHYNHYMHKYLLFYVKISFYMYKCNTA